MQTFIIVDATADTCVPVARIEATNGEEAFIIFQQRLSGITSYTIRLKGTMWQMTSSYGSCFYAINTTK